MHRMVSQTLIKQLYSAKCHSKSHLLVNFDTTYLIDMDLLNDLLSHESVSQVHARLSTEYAQTMETLAASHTALVHTMTTFDAELNIIIGTLLHKAEIVECPDSKDFFEELTRYSTVSQRIEHTILALLDSSRWGALPSKLSQLISLKNWEEAMSLLETTTKDMDSLNDFLPHQEIVQRTETIRKLRGLLSMAVDTALNNIKEKSTKLIGLSPFAISELKPETIENAMNLVNILIKLDNINSFITCRIKNSFSFADADDLEKFSVWLEAEYKWINISNEKSKIFVALIQERFKFPLCAPKKLYKFMENVDKLKIVQEDLFSLLYEENGLFSPITKALDAFPKSNMKCHIESLEKHFQNAQQFTGDDAVICEKWKNDILPGAFAIIDDMCNNHNDVCADLRNHSLIVCVSALLGTLINQLTDTVLPGMCNIRTDFRKITFHEQFSAVLKTLVPVYVDKISSMFPNDLQTSPHFLSNDHAEDILDQGDSFRFPGHNFVQMMMTSLRSSYIEIICKPVLDNISLMFKFKMTQFSMGPSTAISNLGEYLLQLPHHLESINLLEIIAHNLQCEILLQFSSFFEVNDKVTFKKQLSIDVLYIINILESLNCHVSNELKWFKLALDDLNEAKATIIEPELYNIEGNKLLPDLCNFWNKFRENILKLL